MVLGGSHPHHRLRTSMPTDLPPGTTLDDIDAHYAEGLEYPCRLCASAEAEPPTFDLCPNCIADAAAKHRPTMGINYA
jgi:hypothetical protein